MSSVLVTRSRKNLRRLGVVTAAVLVASGASLAFAADRAVDTKDTATAAIAPVEVVQGGFVQFTGAGFVGKSGTGGEVVSVKIDDKAVVNLKKDQVMVVVTSKPDGTISGTVDLSQVHPDTPVNPGPHWLRFLTGTGGNGDPIRSHSADFSVVAPAGVPTPTPTPAPGATPDPGSGTSTGTGTGTENGTVVPPPTIVQTGSVQLTFTNLELVKKKTVTLSMKSGASGSAGTVRIVTKKKFKIGKAKKKQQVLFKSDSYLVEPVSTERVKLALTKEGTTLFKTKKSIDAIVQIRDASGESNVNQPVVIKR